MSRNRMFDREDLVSSNTSSAPSWLDEFAQQWEKTSSVTAVEAARLRQSNEDYYSQISSIVGGKKKHATVDSIVQEYQELTGLKQYLKTLAEKENQNQDTVKTAQDKSQEQGTTINNSIVMISLDEDDDIKLDVAQNLKDKIKTFVNNKINSYYGHVSIPAIQDDLLKSLKNQGLEAYHVYDSNLSKFIGNCLGEYKKNHPKFEQTDGTLGTAIIQIDDDKSNSDFLHSLQKK